MSHRELIANAASTVQGIDCRPYFVQSSTPGTAMVRLNRVEYPNPFGGIAYWDVVVVLPQDMADAEKYLEGVLEPLVTAVAEELVVKQVQPQRMDFPGAGVLPVVIITGHREQE